MYTHTYWAIVVVQASSEKSNNGCPPLWSGHIGLRAIVCVLSTSKIRRKVGPNVWLRGLCAEWARSTGGTIMALARENSTIVLETLMALVGSVWAGLSSSTALTDYDTDNPLSLSLLINACWFPISGSPQTGNTLTSSDSQLLLHGTTLGDSNIGPETSATQQNTNTSILRIHTYYIYATNKLNTN